MTVRGIPFQLKLALAIAVAAALPLGLLSWRVLNLNHNTITELARAHQGAVGVAVRSEIDATLDGAASELLALRQALTTPGRANEQRLATTVALLESSRRLDHLTVFDAQGKVIDAFKKASFASAQIDHVDPQDTSTGLRIGDTTADGDGDNRVVRLDLVLPIDIEQPQHARTGYVGTRLSLAPLQRTVSRIYTDALAGTRDSITVVDRMRRVVATAPLTLDAQGKSPLVSEAKDSAILADLGDELSRLDTFFLKFGEVKQHGETLVATAASVPRFGLAFWVEQPAQRVYQSMTEVRRLVAIAIALSLVVAALVAFFVSRRMAAPVKALAAYAGELGRRHWQARVAVDTGDELQLLADAMNNAAQDLERTEALAARERAIRTDLGRFLPAQLVERVIKDDQQVALGGKRYEISVLFADVVGFTRHMNQREPEVAVALLNELFSILTEIVFRNGGTVDKFIGDCVMAFWGAPDVVADHNVRAVQCAQEMMRFLEAGNARWQQTFGLQLELAIGVASGPAVVGNIGSTTRLEYTAIGETVNLAARLESVARPMQVLVSAATRANMDHAMFHAMGARDLPGYNTPVEVFAIAEI